MGGRWWAEMGWFMMGSRVADNHLCFTCVSCFLFKMTCSVCFQIGQYRNLSSSLLMELKWVLCLPSAAAGGIGCCCCFFVLNISKLRFCW